MAPSFSGAWIRWLSQVMAHARARRKHACGVVAWVYHDGMYPMMTGGSVESALFPGAAFLLGLPLLVLALVLWTVFWKGWALWLAARRNEKIWFVLLLLINTAGILEIVYIFAVAKRSDIAHTDTKPKE